MTCETAWEHVENAEAHRRRGEFSAAGDWFTAAAYEYLGDSPPGFPATTACKGEYMFLLAGVCYRLAGTRDQCVNRCKQGILVAEDLNARHLPVPEDEYWFERARRGVWYEYIGDFRLVGELAGVEEAYTEAKRIYRLGEDPESGMAEQEHLYLFEFFERVVQVSAETDDEWREIRHHTPFTKWVDYKLNTLPDALDDLFTRNEWPL
ncbi:MULTISPECIES: hypothetical protein [Haloprofundus]|uniref:hypothetical protein n=1 Tax=Haloprofundus TaxID=1911573 RepID=UPI000E43CA53|nr:MULTISPECIES: hypothetical protein [Haloprofundus]QCJ46439.1 hypothetical protein FCF25_04590 [Haloprofundus sp. MHR1]